MRIGILAVQLARDSIRGGARDESLEVPVSVAVSLAAGSPSNDDQMPDLRPTPVRPAVEDDAPSHSRSECEHHHRRGSPPCTETPLREGRDVRVVFDPYR